MTNKKRLKYLVRKGVPDTFRAEVWTRCLGSGNLQQANKGLFANLCQSTEVEPDIVNQIEVDLGRTFPSNKMYDKTGLDRLRRVLNAFAAFKPQIGYCQSMNFLAAMLLLFMDEELAFWCLVQMLDSSSSEHGMKLAGYYSVGMEGLRRDMQVLEMIMKHKLPRVLRNFELAPYS
eukprot:GHVS01075548.1.p1 GENE.GHVS01075548.1~~GHVS01075548.1.p1  ORF type:complete len:175 (+),score=17.06 GHVS01075548.1:370-894(+)